MDAAAGGVGGGQFGVDLDSLVKVGKGGGGIAQGKLRQTATDVGRGEQRVERQRRGIVGNGGGVGALRRERVGAAEERAGVGGVERQGGGVVGDRAGQVAGRFTGAATSGMDGGGGRFGEGDVEVHGRHTPRRPPG